MATRTSALVPTGTVRGKFREFEGTVVIGEDLASSKATRSVKVASIDTGEADRDTHLRSADFFDANTASRTR